MHFDAEEWGLIGSRAFVQRPPVPASAIVFMLNLDMVGRLYGRDLLIDGSAADPPTRALADSVAKAVGLPATRSNVPTTPCSARSECPRCRSPVDSIPTIIA